MTKLSMIAAAALVVAASTAGAQVTQQWIVRASDARSWLSNTDGNLARGATYDPIRDEIYVLTRETIATVNTNIARINPATGADISVTGLTGVSGGTLTLATIDVDEDLTAPKIYFNNVQATWQSAAFKIYRVSTPSQTAVDTVYNASNTALGAGTHRVGDGNLAVVGSGTSTEIWVGTNATGATNFQLSRLTTTDGNTFTVANNYLIGTGTAALARLGLSVTGTGGSQKIFAKTGSAPSAITITGASTATAASITASPTISTSLSSIAYAAFSGKEYIAMAPGATVAQPPEFHEISGTAATSLGASSAVNSTGRANGNGNSSAMFDTTRKRAITFATNNSLASFSFAPTLSVSDWSLLNED